jgi:hypothetical protein
MLHTGLDVSCRLGSTVGVGQLGPYVYFRWGKQKFRHHFGRILESGHVKTGKEMGG